MDGRKRWIAVARRAGGRWALDSPQPVGEVGTLFDRLRNQAGGGPVALGVDLPLGVPRAYAALRAEPDFPSFLARTHEWPGFYRVCAELHELALDRPFYPARGVKGMTRAAHAAALGIGTQGAALSRLCDRATAERPAGAPVFWTLGANQSGKAALSAWRDLLHPALTTARAGVGLWPFDGPFRTLLRSERVAIAETYPAEALRHLGLRLAGSKRRQADRAALAAALLGAMAGLGIAASPALHAAALDGFGTDAAGEDRFDCVLGVLCVINVLAGNRPDTAPPDPWLRWEGWVLGQTALPLGAASLHDAAGNEPGAPDADPAQDQARIRPGDGRSP